MLINNENPTSVNAMAVSFSYTDEVDENYEDSDILLPDDEDDFASVGDDTLNKFDDDFDETIDDSIDDTIDDDYSSDFDSSETDYNDELSEDYSSDEE